MKSRLLVAVVFVLFAANGFAQSSVPAEDLAALQRAVQETPRDAMLHFRLSQFYAVLNQPQPALEAVERALTLSPDSGEFLRARGTLATWLGDYGRAQDSYRRLQEQFPEDRDVTLSLARVSAWGGKTDAAVEAYKRYLHVEPAAAAAWIELARAESWRGNYSEALESLETYQTRFGKDAEYSRELAAVLARAGRPGKALDTLEPILSQQPDDYALNLTRTIALTMAGRAREATDALETVERLQPNASDTQAAARVVRAALASTAEPVVTFYSDSSSLEVQRFAPRVTLPLATGTTFGVGYERNRLSARRGSGLEQIGANPDALHDQFSFSARQRLGALDLRGRIGRERAASRSHTSYGIGAGLTSSNGLKLSFESTDGLFVVSPRTVGLGLRQIGHQAQFDWSPAVGSQVVLNVLHQSLSDGNRRWELTFAPRRSFARTERLNLDLGVLVSRLGTATNLDNGYYDPRRYEYYAATANPYFKISERLGVGLSLALGAQRDDFSPGFRLGGNATGEATWGIYDAWMLKVTGGATFNQRLGSGAFRGYGAGVSLVRRF